MRVGLAQVRPRLGRVDENIEQHQLMIHRAKEEEVDLLVFPELSLTGYQLLDLTYEVARNPFSPEIQSIVQLADEMDIVFGFVEHSPEHMLYNSAIYASRGQMNYLHRKVFLPTYGMFDEGRYYGQGSTIRSFQTQYGLMGMAICEDLWHPSTGYLLSQDGALFMIVLANSPAKGVGVLGLKSQQSWYSLLSYQAMIHGSYVLFANRVGSEDGSTFFGGSAVVDPFGEIEGQADLFDEDLLIVDLELDKIRQARFQMPMLRYESTDLTIHELQRIQRKRRGEGS